MHWQLAVSFVSSMVRLLWTSKPMLDAIAWLCAVASKHASVSS